jgi:opacity protein-like surface antigen
MKPNQRNPWRFALLFFIFVLAVSEALMAGETNADNPFQKGLFETSLGGGAMFSPFPVGLDRPTLDYTLTEAQLGYMLTDVSGPVFCRGNLEAVGGVFGGGIFEGDGNYVAGTTLWLRYNLVPRGSRFAPFLQAGAGLTETDLNRRLEGQSFNFNLNLGIGARYLFARNWSLNLEYRYQHISNANMSSHNQGVNADGPMLSVSYFF